MVKLSKAFSILGDPDERPDARSPAFVSGCHVQDGEFAGEAEIR